MSALILHTRNDTAIAGETLGRLLDPGDVVALIGDLGAGKTTLTQAIARGMGVVAPVTSPTFTLVHEYDGDPPLFHFDPYRLTRPEDLYDLAFDDYLRQRGVIVVEWADKVASQLPYDRLTLRLTPLETNDDELEDSPRQLVAEPVGPRYNMLVSDWSIELAKHGLTL